MRETVPQPRGRRELARAKSAEVPGSIPGGRKLVPAPVVKWYDISLPSSCGICNPFLSAQINRHRSQFRNHLKQPVYSYLLDLSQDLLCYPTT